MNDCIKQLFLLIALDLKILSNYYLAINFLDLCIIPLCILSIEFRSYARQDTNND